MVKRALLIGINYYGGDHALAGCINDIIAMKKYLAERQFTEFTILQDRWDDQSHQKSDCPTRANIISAMNDIVNKSSSGDTLFVHYSGHGAQLYDTNGDEKTGMDSCICPVDFDINALDYGFIRDDTLNDILVKRLPDGVKLRVVFDACHSGSALDLPYRYDRDQFDIENTDVLKKDVVFISGCRDEEKSADSVFNNVAAGALSWSLMKALGKSPSTWKDLIHLVRTELISTNYTQRPQLDVEDKAQILQPVDL